MQPSPDVPPRRPLAPEHGWMPRIPYSRWCCPAPCPTRRGWGCRRGCKETKALFSDHAPISPSGWWLRTRNKHTEVYVETQRVTLTQARSGQVWEAGIFSLSKPKIFTLPWFSSGYSQAFMSKRTPKPWGRGALSSCLPHPCSEAEQRRGNATHCTHQDQRATNNKAGVVGVGLAVTFTIASAHPPLL